MNLVRSLDNANAWAVGRFDALRTQSHLPDSVLSQIPAITWFAVSGHVNGGLRGTLRAEARDDESANNLRDVVRGFLALAKLGSGAKPELQAMMQSLELGGTGQDRLAVVRRARRSVRRHRRGDEQAASRPRTRVDDGARVARRPT